MKTWLKESYTLQDILQFMCVDNSLACLQIYRHDIIVLPWMISEMKLLLAQNEGSLKNTGHKLLGIYKYIKQIKMDQIKEHIFLNLETYIGTNK
jgi:hypothetical protein